MQNRLQNRILILAPTGRDAVLTAGVLAGAGMDSMICASVAELLEQLQAGAGAILTVEEALNAVLEPLSRYVAEQPNWSDIAILLLTHRGADAPNLSRAIKLLGNITVLERPVRTLAIVSALRSALRARQKQYQVREAGQRKDEFLASLGHELRNPLAPIRNSMGILKHLYPDVPVVGKVRTVIERQVTHLTRLVDDLLDVARITNGKITLQPAAFTLAAAVEHVLELASTPLQGKMIRLDTVLPPAPVHLYGDYARIIQIVANILLNAVKFTPAEGTIRFEARVENDNVVFCIRDTGIGLSEHAHESIFELFAQEKPASGPVTSGLGIGLNLSKTFTEMHGGSIHVHSDGLGKGSEFTVRMPIVVVDASPVAGDDAADATAEGASLQPTVLVVDDNRDAANMLQTLFELEQYKVATAYDGFDAIAAVKQAMPNFIVMDLGMPGIDGYDTVRQIRKQPGAADITIVALTGWGQSEARIKATAAGFDHHMVKPVDFDALKTLFRPH